jgi:signal peptidase I
MSAMSTELAAEFVPELLARDGLAWVTAASSSMAPLIQPGDGLRVAPLGAGRARVGTIVVYRRDAKLVVHRVMAAGRDGLVTRGDALEEADPPVDWSRVVGRVSAIRTPGGRTLELDRAPWPALEHVLGWLCDRRARGGIAWIACRAPFHLAARLLR